VRAEFGDALPIIDDGDERLGVGFVLDNREETIDG